MDAASPVAADPAHGEPRLRTDGEAARLRIQAAVAANPGINVRQLCREVDLAWSTVAYHLGVLQRRQALHASRQGRELHLFSGDVPHDVRAVLHVLRDDGAERVLAAVQRMPAEGVPGLSAALGLSHKVTRKHLGRLRAAGLVEALRDHRPLYRSTEEATRLLDQAAWPERPAGEGFPPPP